MACGSWFMAILGRKRTSSHPSFRASALRFFWGLLASAIPLSAGAQEASSLPLIGDVAKVKGVDENVFVGTGLVVGLSGTGDKSPSTSDIARYLLKELGNEIAGDRFKSKNVALVTLTVRIPAFKKRGDRVDVEVQAVNDATSLAGGTLLPTPLQGPWMGPGGQRPVVAVAQGSVSIGNADRAAHPTSGQIPAGAVIAQELQHLFLDGSRILALPAQGAAGMKGLLTLVQEKEELRSIQVRVRDADALEFLVPESAAGSTRSFVGMIERVLGSSARVVGVGRVHWDLDTPHFDAAHKMAEEISQRWRGLCPRLAVARDAGTVEVYIPREYLDDPVAFIAKVETYPAPALAAENLVVIDERNGTIGVTGDVWVDPGWIEVGQVEISVSEPRRLVDVLSDVKKLRSKGSALPRAGAAKGAPEILTTRDMIVALQKMKRVGMLRAKLVVD